MKKLLLFCLAIFALNVSSYAQVEVTPSAEETMTIKKKKRAVKTSKSNEARLSKKGAASTPAERTQKIVDRINTKLVASDPALALNDAQKEALVKIHTERQLVQQNRPTLETEADKTAYKESRRAASKEFRTKMADVLTPEQSAVYLANKERQKSGKRVKSKKGKTVPAIQKSEKF